MMGTDETLKTELVSIVVPVYNGEAYLEQCISSILNQTYQNIELILVNDGSTDRSGEICERYSSLDTRVRVILQKNQGGAAARKHGTELARGNYVGYSDQDDFIEPDLYQRLMECCNGFDLVVAQWIREDGIHTRRAHDNLALGAYTTQEDLEFLLDHMINLSLPGGRVNIKSGLAGFMWNKLFKTELANQVFQETNIAMFPSDDLEFTFRYILKCRSVLLTDICGYHYRIRRDSNWHSTDPGCAHLKNACEFYESLRPAFMAHPRREKLLPQLELKLAFLLIRAPAKMGFGPEAQLQLKTPIFPFINQLDNCHIALFGAGSLGQSYRRQIETLHCCELDVWVDREWKNYQREGLNVLPPEALRDGKYEFVILASPDEASASEGRQQLLSMGICEKMILWKAPLFVDG